MFEDVLEGVLEGELEWLLEDGEGDGSRCVRGEGGEDVLTWCYKVCKKMHWRGCYSPCSGDRKWPHIVDMFCSDASEAAPTSRT